MERAGGWALGLLSTPISARVLQALERDGSQRLVDLQRACGSPAQTTLRAHLRELEAVGAIAKHKGSSFPGTVECELTVVGRELCLVASTVQRWLETAPEGPLEFASQDAKAAIKALLGGWSSAMLRAIAARPLSLTELDGLITGVSYPSLERRLSAMKLARQVIPCPGAGDGTGTPYGVTEWLRRGVAPLTAAILWERRRIEAAKPLTRIDMETVFLLALPLLRVDSDLAGSCRLGVEVSNGNGRGLVGATAYLDSGVTAASAQLESDADAWITGTPGAWLEGLVEADSSRLELGGVQQIASAILDGLQEALFATARAADSYA